MQMTGAAAALFLLILSGAAEAGEAVSATGKKFVDERFYQVLEPFSKISWLTILRPEKIVQDSQAGAVYEWTDCRLLENRIGYVKLECDNPYRKNKGGRRDILEYTIEREGYEEGTLMVRHDWVGSVSYYTIKDPDYGKEEGPAAKADEGKRKSDILII